MSLNLSTQVEKMEQSSKAAEGAETSSAPHCPIEAVYISEKQRSNSSCSSQQTAGGYAPIISEADAKRLGNSRTESTIPGKSSNWVYPSERQFYRSTIAKGHHVDATVIPTVVQIHNAINEKAWEKVMDYENMHLDQCSRPLLAHFIGKKDDLSIRARMNTFLGYKAPYDRHDWTVDRCGKLVRYIIDFYEGKAPNNEPLSVYMDVRPAITFEGLVDRTKMWFRRKFN